MERDSDQTAIQSVNHVITYAVFVTVMIAETQNLVLEIRHVTYSPRPSTGTGVEQTCHACPQTDRLRMGLNG